MVVKLKRRNTRYRDLTFGQLYVVIGVEADEFRILNDAGNPFLYPPGYSQWWMDGSLLIGCGRKAKMASGMPILHR